MLPKLVISFSLLVISLFITPFSAHAQTAIPSYVPPTSPLYTDLLVNNLFHSFSCLAVGQSVIGQPCLSYLKGVPVLTKVNTTGGALGATTSLIAMLYANPPVRTADYLSSIGEGMGIVKEANAQVVGSGAAVLNPIIKLWQVSRNISYVFMIVIFLIIGLMIMFRNKLNPQTVITAQAALPGMVIGLILITFSFFLAGLISDMAFVGTNVVGYYFETAKGNTSPESLAKKLEFKNVTNIFGEFIGVVDSGKVTSVLESVYKSLPPGIQDTLSWFAGLLAFQFAGQLGGVFGPYAAIAGPILGLIGLAVTKATPTNILGFFLSFVAVFILIYAMLKLLFRLITCYLTIIFLTISAPFQFLAASLPGRQGITTGWILNMLANVLVFPAVIAVFYFVAFILGSSNISTVFITNDSSRTNTTAFVPTVYAQDKQDKIEVIGKDNFPLFGNMDLSFIKMLLAFGALVALPTIPDLVVRAIGKAGQAGQLIGQEIAGSTRTGQGYFGQTLGRAQQAGQSTFTGIFGERTLYRESGGGIGTMIQKPGLIHLPEKFGWGKKPE